METLLNILLIVMLVMSGVTFILYAADKHKAKKHKWRISEKTLLLCGVCGGAAGALLGMKYCRHKTKHWYFWAVNLVSFAAQTAGCVLLYLHR